MGTSASRTAQGRTDGANCSTGERGMRRVYVSRGPSDIANVAVQQRKSMVPSPWQAEEAKAFYQLTLGAVP